MDFFFFLWSYIFYLFITLVLRKTGPSFGTVTPQAPSAAWPKPSAHGLCSCLMLSPKQLVAIHERGKLRSIADIFVLVRTG